MGGGARFGSRRWIVTGAIAVVSAVLVPVVYSAGLAYGSAWLEWDAANATNYYVERPGGFVVLVVSLILSVAFGASAVAFGALTIRDLVKAGSASRRRGSHPA